MENKTQPSIALETLEKQLKEKQTVKAQLEQSYFGVCGQIQYIKEQINTLRTPPKK